MQNKNPYCRGKNYIPVIKSNSLTLMARRKKIKSRTRKVSFKTGWFKKKRKGRSKDAGFKVFLKVLAIVAVCGAVGIGFVFLSESKYIKKEEKKGPSKLINAPEWLTEQLKAKIYTAAAIQGEVLKLDENVARQVQQNIKAQVAWVKDVKVQTTADSLLIEAQWRKPLALVKLGVSKFYVDSELVALDFVPMPNLPVVTVNGLSFVRNKPQIGEVWRLDDLAEAIAILVRLEEMDKAVAADKPLLYEIDSIDVSNFNGRQKESFPHIILYATDDTEIIWGAELGSWQRYLEATDEEKLARLYSYYHENGTLLDGVKYINLRDPQEKILQPIDRY